MPTPSCARGIRTLGRSMAGEWARGFTPGATVLELGCGDGVISQVLVDAGLTLYGAGCFADTASRLP